MQAVNRKRLNNIYSDEEIDDTDVQEENRNSVNDAASSCKYASKCWQKAAKAENKNISQWTQAAEAAERAAELWIQQSRYLEPQSRTTAGYS